MEIGQEGARTARTVSAGQSEGAPATGNGDISTNMTLVPPAKDTGDNDLASDISIASDSDSDVSDSSDSPEPVTETKPPAKLDGTETIQGGMDTASKKRKSPGGDSQGSEQGERLDSEPHKKARLDNGSQESAVSSNCQVPDKSLLAPEVWHHIFTFCPPKTLGNLLRVNKLFHQYLSPSSSAQVDFPSSATRGVLNFLKPNNIWQSSRRLFWSHAHMPAPLRSMSEPSMWRLLCSTKCQECNKSPAEDVELPTDNLHNGPGSGGVTLIWPFGIRVCGPCLLQKAVKVRHLLFSNSH